LDRLSKETYMYFSSDRTKIGKENPGTEMKDVRKKNGRMCCFGPVVGQTSRGKAYVRCDDDSVQP